MSVRQRKSLCVLTYIRMSYNLLLMLKRPIPSIGIWRYEEVYERSAVSRCQDVWVYVQQQQCVPAKAVARKFAMSHNQQTIHRNITNKRPDLILNENHPRNGQMCTS
jgi:hypothetical protein